MKSLDLLDSLVLEVLDRLRFKDITTGQIKDVSGVKNAQLLRDLRETENTDEALEKTLKVREKMGGDILSKA